ncbi:hypothetical protein ATANTOWER_024461 [Ataeniobius toweri]|uniref:Uncharacterized protein n=1 Tax=Ataeniobius toweri TaxID=208326 RepID=A0ABU7C9A8_9TELE|nr:hypothetical protein [Ataeniobius toweri]
MQQEPELLTFQAGAESRGKEALICSGMLVCSHRDPRTKTTFQHSSLLLHQQALLLCSSQLSEDSVIPSHEVNHTSSLR